MEPDYKNAPEPDLATKPQSSPSAEQKPFSMFSIARFAGVALLLGAIALGINALTGGGTGGPDKLTPSQASAFTEQFQNAVPLLLPLTPVVQHESAIEQLDLSPAQEQQLRKDIAAGLTTFVTASFSDFIEVDGDAISIHSTLFSGDVLIGHDGYTIALPVNVENPAFSVTGISDGLGGGVTLRVVTSSGGVVPLPPLEVGQTVTIPLVLP